MSFVSGLVLPWALGIADCTVSGNTCPGTRIEDRGDYANTRYLPGNPPRFPCLSNNIPKNQDCMIPLILPLSHPLPPEP